MANEKLIRKVEIVYTALKRAVHNQNYLHRSVPSYKNCVNKFVDIMIKKYGGLSDERIVDYSILAFYYFRNQPKFTVHQIYGEKVIQNVESKGKGSVYIAHKWLKQLDLSKTSLLNLIQQRDTHPLDQYVFLISEEQTKKRKFNTEIGFALCNTSTTGWTPLSPTCVNCNFDERCKQNTAKRYPELYRLRLTHDVKR